MSKYKGFDSVELKRPKRSMFDMSHERRLSTRMGRLTPVFISETLPNDTFHVSTEVMLRLAPLLAPIMHRVNVFVHYFFVPNRLLANWWESFITGGRLGAEVAAPPVPSYQSIGTILGYAGNYLDESSLFDYLGGAKIPDADVALWTGTRKLDLLPFAAYQKVWYDYYRDRNYVADPTIFPMVAGVNNGQDFYKIRTRAWEHDYFTSAQTNTQRGTEVLMPLEGTGTVTYLASSVVKNQDGSNPDAGTLQTTVGGVFQDSGATASRLENIDDVLLTSSDVSINDFRRAMALQQWMERNQLAGSRYNESIMAHFGRRTSDARLQRAEYLGGGKVVVKISEVVTTAYSEDDAAQTVPPGNMAGHGVSFGDTNKFSYNCEEHGFVIGIMSVMPTSGYMQGIPRMFLRRNSFLDYPWPSFAHLGEQEVYKHEIYADPTNVPVDETLAPIFGYQSRYADWKHMSSSCHGDFKSSLDFWHLTRKFSSSPVLGETFVTFEDALQDRVFAVSGVDTLWCYIYNNVKVTRSLPYFGAPSGLVGN